MNKVETKTNNQQSTISRLTRMNEVEIKVNNEQSTDKKKNNVCSRENVHSE
jgi:hypothetical protein